MTGKDKLSAFGDSISRTLREILDQFDAEAALDDLGRSQTQSEIAGLREQVRTLEADLATARRRKEMFHRALYIYLQEREGPAGVNAPTPETLALIRDLATNLDA